MFIIETQSGVEKQSFHWEYLSHIYAISDIKNNSLIKYSSMYRHHYDTDYKFKIVYV